MRLLLLLVAFSVIASASYSQTTTQPAVAVDSQPPFESEIRAFEDADRLSRPKTRGVLFVGSSSIRLWPDLKASFPGINVIQRGFGGSQLDEVVYYTPRIVLPYRPNLIVLYAGDNDLAAGRTPEQISADFKAFVTIVHDWLPDTRIAFVSIKPSGDRFSLIDKMRATNLLIRSYIATDPKLTYVDVFTPMLGADGKPREELFVSDRLHMNRDGYMIWRDLLAPIVAAAVTPTPATSR